MQYDITKEDLLGAFPYSSVLQNKWGTKAAYKYAHNRVEYIIKRYKAGKISFEEAKAKVTEVVIEAKARFSSDFVEEGWLKRTLEGRGRGRGKG